MKLYPLTDSKIKKVHSLRCMLADVNGRWYFGMIYSASNFSNDGEDP